MSVRNYSLSREGERQLSRHFRVREFACHDGSDLVKIDTALVDLLENLREAAGEVGLIVNSGYRTESYNKQVGGAPRSQHLLGMAADIQIQGVPPLLLGQMAEYYLEGRGGIGVYQAFTHVDTRAGRARWDQRSGKPVAVSGWPGWRPQKEEAMDNTPKPYAEKAVEWAVQQGLLQGNNGDLMLNQPVTRQQLAVLLYRYSQLEQSAPQITSEEK